MRLVSRLTAFFKPVDRAMPSIADIELSDTPQNIISIALGRLLVHAAALTASGG